MFKKKFIITFGQGHIHNVHNKVFDHNCVAVIKAKNMTEARQKAFDLFSLYWHYCLTELEYEVNDMAQWFPRGRIKV